MTSLPSALDVSSLTSPLCHSMLDRKPLLLAAYKFGEPYRKRRVKVPADILWKDFLVLFYSRLELNRDLDIEIFDENGIEIVSVDDLVDNDVLVIKEKRPAKPKTSSSAASTSWVHHPGNRHMVTRNTPSDPPRRSHDQAPPTHSTSAPLQLSSSSRVLPGGSGSHTPTLMVGTPVLSHFIQCNSFGFYFLAEAENLKMKAVPGRSRRVHCVVKVPHVNLAHADNLRVLEGESALLCRISYHKSIISPPEVHAINFSDSKLQRFYSSVPQQKQGMLQQLFTMGGGPKDTYVYPLYGITMATKIKNGLTPDRVLKYAYQLADIMYFLQQKGVIHQSLLPENIQVMSNDRVIICNFETAIQTDPNTCLLVLSAGVPPPSNQSGLAPELIGAFVRLRIKPETVDYSTQYPWMFGVLCILIATGTHPLSDYPSKYEENHKIRYKSHQVQSLPDPTQYPPVFMKLVKRTILCDPVRRPTLQQILTVFRRDPKILSLMTGNRLPTHKGRRGSFPATISKGVNEQRVTQGHLHHVTQSQQHVTQDLMDLEGASQEQTADRLLSDTCGAVAAPLVGFFSHTDPDHCHMTPLPADQPLPVVADASTKSESRGPNRSSRSHDQCREFHETPPRHAALSIPGNESAETVGSKETCNTFTNNTTITSTSQASPVAVTMCRVPLRTAHTRAQEITRPLKRYGSVGDFPDDLALCSLPRGLTRSVHDTGSTSCLPSAQQERLHDRVPERRTDLLAHLSLARSDGDIKKLQELPGQRCTHSRNGASSQHTPLTCRVEEDLEHHIHPSSPDINYSVRVPKNTDLQVQNNHSQIQNTELLAQNIDPLVQNTDPGIAAQSVFSGTGISTEEVSTLEDEANAKTTHLPNFGLCTDVFLLKGNTTSVVQSGDHHMTNNSASIAGPDTLPRGAEAIISRGSGSVTMQASATDASSAEVRGKSGSVEVIFTQGGQVESEECERNAAFSPDLSTSGSHPEGSDKEFWSGMLGLNSDPGRLPGGEEDRVTSSASPQSVDSKHSGDGHARTLFGDHDSNRSVASPPSLEVPNMDLTSPQTLDSDRHLSGETDLQTGSEGVLSLIESEHMGGTASLSVDNFSITPCTSTANADHSSPLLADATSSNSRAAEGCNVMLPITKVSQELTDSASQHSINRYSASNLQSAEKNRSSQSTMGESGQLSPQRQPVATCVPIGTGVNEVSSSVASRTWVARREHREDQPPLNHTDMYQDDLGEVSINRREDGVGFSEDSTQNGSRRSTNVSVMEDNMRTGECVGGISHMAGGDHRVLDREGRVHDGTRCVATIQTSTNAQVFTNGDGLASTTQQQTYSRVKRKSAGRVPPVDGHGDTQLTESLQRGDSPPPMHRNSTHYGGAGDSSKCTNQGGPNRLGSRPISPLSVSARSSHNHSVPSTQCQSTLHGKGRDQMQGRSHRNQTSSQGRGQANQSCQQGRGRSNVPRGRGERCELPQQVGDRGAVDYERQITGKGGSQTPAQNGGSVNSSRVRYSQPRQDIPRLQYRIKQDLEAMNFAISGMDSQTSTASFNHPMNSPSGVTGGWLGDQWGGVSRQYRSEQASQQLAHNPAQQSQQKISRLHQVQHQRTRMQQTQRSAVCMQNQPSMASQQNRTADPNNPSRTFNPSPATCRATGTTSHTGIPAQNHFRPVTPATMAGYQLSSSPRQSGEDSPSSTRLPLTPPLQGSTVVSREHHPSNQGYHSHLRNARQFAHATGHQGHNAMMMANVPQPPQVTADSYDYLPPYSPPMVGPTLDAQTRQQLPPPSQQQQQQQGQNGARLSGGSYPEPPPSYDEIFGKDELTSPNQTRRETRNVRERDGDREQSSQTRFRHRERINSSPSNFLTASPTTARSSGLGRLTSITNLFRRTPKTSHSEAEHQVVGVEDYTAQWVASYNHTPRPHRSQHLPSNLATFRNSPTNTSHQQHQQNRPSHNPPQRSSSAAGLAEYGIANCPIPYVHPPPFQSTDHAHQVDISGHGLVAGGSRNMNLSMTCLSTVNSPENPGSQAFVRNTGPSFLSRDRPRPTSAYFPSESRILRFPDPSASSSQVSAPTSIATPCQQATTSVATPGQQAQLINSNTTKTGSCTNISAEEKVKTPSGVLRRRGSERTSRRRWFAYLKHAQKVQDQNTPSQQQPPRVSAPTADNSAPTGDNSQPEAKHTHIPGGPAITTSHGQGSSDNHQKAPSPVRTAIHSPPHTLRETNRDVSNPMSQNSPGGHQDHANNMQHTTGAVSVHNSTSFSPKKCTRVNPGNEGSGTTNTIPPAGRGRVDTSPSVIADSPQVHSSSNSIDSSVVNSHSSRSAIRLRAEARRSSLLTSSSEDDLLSELSQNTSTHSRLRRRRWSQGSNSLVGGGQPNVQGECHVEMRDEAVLGGEVGVEESGARAWQDVLMRGQTDGSDTRAVEEDAVQLDGGDGLSGQEESVQDIIDVNLLSAADSAHSHVRGKSCGHACQGAEEALCCLCWRREVTSSTMDHRCPLCARRSSNTQEVLFELGHNQETEMDITTSDHLNMKVTSFPHQDHTPPQTAQYASNKNCSVM